MFDDFPSAEKYGSMVGRESAFVDSEASDGRITYMIAHSSQLVEDNQQTPQYPTLVGSWVFVHDSNIFLTKFEIDYKGPNHIMQNCIDKIIVSASFIPEFLQISLVADKCIEKILKIVVPSRIMFEISRFTHVETKETVEVMKLFGSKCNNLAFGFNDFRERRISLPSTLCDQRLPKLRPTSCNHDTATSYAFRARVHLKEDYGRDAGLVCTILRECMRVDVAEEECRKLSP